jgi:hypothetical protein
VKEDRKLEFMSLAKIRRAKKNPKLHADDAIAASVGRFGYVEPIVLDERTKRLVAGHGRLDVLARMKEAGEKPPAGVRVERGEWLVPVIRGWRSKNDRDAEAYLVASNRTVELGGWDDAELAKMLKSMGRDEMAATGFGSNDLDAMMQALRDSESATGVSLADRFIVPPFSVLDARQGYWQERKRAWIDLGIQSEVGRGENLLQFSDTVQMRKAGRLRQGAVDVTREATAGGTSIFDPVLCELIYRWFGKVGFRVLDPFAGGSVRGIVAAKLGLRYHGIELRPEQVKANEVQANSIFGENFEEGCSWRAGDSYVALDDVPSQFDLIIGCPPYMDLEVYSDDPKDLSAMSPEEFEAVYRAIIAKTVSKLRDNRFAVFVVGEVRDPATGFYKGFVQMTIDAFQKSGARLYNEAVLVTAVGSLSMRVGSFFPKARKLGKTHQNVLVFFKGDPDCIVDDLGELEISEEALAMFDPEPEYGRELP